MNADDILNIIGETDDKFVRDAHESSSNRRKRQIFNLAIGAAACLVLAPTVLFGGMWLFFGGMGAAAPGPAPEMSESATPADPVHGPSHYTGPVLALTAVSDSYGITARQKLDISFAPIYDGNMYEPFVRLTDNYTLTNTLDDDINLTLAYPYVSSYYDADNYGAVPQISVNDSPIEGKIVYGPYTGTFVPVYGAENDPEMATANLFGPSSINDYMTLLHNGDYMIRTFAEIPGLDQKVTVYKLSDYEYTSDKNAPNPTLNFRYEADRSKTKVLTWNFNGGSNFEDEGRYERHTGGIEVRPQASPENVYPNDAYLIVLGDDISSYSVAGYPDGGCEKGKELADLGCSVTRYEARLGEVLRELIETRHFYGNEFRGDTDALYNLVAASLMDFGPIGENPVTRYSHGFLDEFVYDVAVQSRIAYITFPLSVPAGSSMEIELTSLKNLSYNYYGTGNTDLYRFEFAGNLGSSLDFRSVLVTISDYEGIEITEDSFEFDIPSGKVETEIELSQFRYWRMDIQEKQVEE